MTIPWPSGSQSLYLDPHLIWAGASVLWVAMIVVGAVAVQVLRSGK